MSVLKRRNTMRVITTVIINSQKCLVIGRIIVIMHQSGAWLPFLIEFEKYIFYEERCKLLPVQSGNSSHLRQNLHYKYCN